MKPHKTLATCQPSVTHFDLGCGSKLAVIFSLSSWKVALEKVLSRVRYTHSLILQSWFSSNHLSLKTA